MFIRCIPLILPRQHNFWGIVRLADRCDSVSSNVDSEESHKSSLRARFIRTVLRMVGRSGSVSILAALLLEAKARRCRDVEDYVDLSLNFHLSFQGYRIQLSPAQVKDEMTRLARFVYDMKPKAVLEIGTASGGTLFLWCRLASADATIISIDLPGGPFGGGYPEWRISFYKKMARGKQTLELLRQNSHDPATLRDVMRILNGHEVDFLFIDGDHTYEGVKSDFDMYSPLVKNGGIIAFHDIVPHPDESTCQVSRFWNQVKATRQHLEIVESWEQRWAGLGVLFV